MEMAHQRNVGCIITSPLQHAPPHVLLATRVRAWTAMERRGALDWCAWKSLSVSSSCEEVLVEAGDAAAVLVRLAPLLPMGWR